jgi:hypothetical protein
MSRKSDDKTFPVEALPEVDDRPDYEGPARLLLQWRAQTFYRSNRAQLAAVASGGYSAYGRGVVMATWKKLLSWSEDQQEPAIEYSCSVEGPPCLLELIAAYDPTRQFILVCYVRPQPPDDRSVTREFDFCCWAVRPLDELHRRAMTLLN